MNHYENDTITRVKDKKPSSGCSHSMPALFDVVMREDISMCGFGPAVVMLTATKRLGQPRLNLIQVRHLR